MPEEYLTKPEIAGAKGMIVAFHANHSPERMAIMSEQGSRTYKQLNNRINQIAASMRDYGLVPGDAVSLICSNRPEFAEVLMACLRTGIRVSPVNWHLAAPEITYIVDNSDSKMIFGDIRFKDHLEKVIKECPQVKLGLSVGGDIEGFEDLEGFIAGAPTENIADPTPGFQMLYTSGTTGYPKGVFKEPTGKPAPPNPLTEAADYNPATDTALCTGPLYHAAPLGLDLLAALGNGIGCYLTDKWDPEETLRLIHAYKITHSHMVPTMFHRMLALPEDVRAKYDVSSLKFIIHGAAPCPVHVKEAMFEWFGHIIYEYYGATEGMGSIVNPDDWFNKQGSVGPAPEGLVIVDEETDKEMPTGEVGIIWIPVPETGTFTYYKAEEKTAGAYRNGTHFSMHDVGYVDADGYLYMSDRRNDLILSGGVNIYPAEVDAAVLKHSDVFDACTIGLPSEDWGQSVMTVVQLKDGVAESDELKKELMAHCAENIAKYKCPRSIEFVAELPRSDAGKIQRFKVRQQYVPDAKK